MKLARSGEEKRKKKKRKRKGEEVHVEKGKYKVKSKPIELLANVESRATISLNDSKQRARG